MTEYPDFELPEFVQSQLSEITLDCLMSVIAGMKAGDIVGIVENPPDDDDAPRGLSAVESTMMLMMLEAELARRRQ